LKEEESVDIGKKYRESLENQRRHRSLRNVGFRAGLTGKPPQEMMPSEWYGRPLREGERALWMQGYERGVDRRNGAATRAATRSQYEEGPADKRKKFGHKVLVTMIDRHDEECETYECEKGTELYDLLDELIRGSALQDGKHIRLERD
jgi:hypothetical protein